MAGMDIVQQLVEASEHYLMNGVRALETRP